MGGTTLSRNVVSLRKHLRLKQDAFAERVNTSQANISKYETRGITPGSTILAAMADLANVSIADFIKNAWVAPTSDSPVADQPPTRSADAGDTVKILQLDLSLAMGPGTMIEDFVESEEVDFDASALRRITRTPSDRLRFVTGIGTSHEPKFLSGDQFLINMNERSLARLDGYYWITFEGAHGLKRLRPLGGGRTQIISENPEFAPIDVESNAVRIEGRAIWFARGL